MDGQKLIIPALVLATLGGLALGFRWGDTRGERRGFAEGYAEAQAGFKPDTLIVDHWDTIGVPTPVYLTKLQLDTMWLPSSVVIEETEEQTAVYREQAHYRDSTYEAWVSGYDPALDSLRIFRHDVTVYVDRVRQVRVKPRWSFSATMGPGLIVNSQGQPDVGIGVTVGLTYRLR